MNCVLHYLENNEDIPILENNYDILYPEISNQFLISFAPNSFPQRYFIQSFYKKIDFIDDHHKEYSKYFFLYQINKFLQSKKYKRILFISANLKLKQSSGLLQLLSEINCFDRDMIKFTLDNQICKDMFMSRIWMLDNNLDYANCTYEQYCNRQRYDNFQVYINSPFEKLSKLEDYMSDVILFLTTPSTPEREKLSLTNLRQLKKLGKDIIVLSTITNINDEYYDLANLVVFDVLKGTIDRAMYKKGDEYPVPFIKPHGSFYYYFLRAGYKIYVNTNWLAVYRNTKNLMKLAYSLNYTNFLYIEDDHYFSDYGLNKINEYFKTMRDNNLNGIYFTNVWHGSPITVIHSHFWFGNTSYFNESIIEKFPETYDELESQFPYTCDYESFLSHIMLTTTYNKNNILLESVREGGFKRIFGEDTNTNQIYSYFNISDDSRISFIYSNQPNLYKLIFNLENIIIQQDPTDVKIYADDQLYLGIKLNLSNAVNMLDINMNLENQTTIKIMFGNDVVKEFKNITHKDVIKNGSWIK